MGAMSTLTLIKILKVFGHFQTLMPIVQDQICFHGGISLLFSCRTILRFMSVSLTVLTSMDIHIQRIIDGELQKQCIRLITLLVMLLTVMKLTMIQMMIYFSVDLACKRTS